jgi:hypothetical protein
MELIKFSSQLGGKDPTQPPFRIPAKDLDSNFAKLRPLPTDGNARQYAIDETPDGWFLRLFPDSESAATAIEQIGATSEAPIDGNTYGRKDASWSPLNLVPNPPTTGTHVLASQNGVLTWLGTEACAT